MTMTHATYPSLAGRTVIVSGGGSGIGAELVTGFVRQNSRVYFLDIAEDSSHALVDQLGGKATFRRCDITDIEALRSTLATIEFAIA